jgi:hypothetical protein
VWPHATLVARLHPPVRKEGVRYSGLYCVEFDGERIVVGSRDPECDVARTLLARGITGKFTMVDANTGRARTVIDIERAAMLTVREGPLRFASHESRPERAPAAEDEVILVTIPPEANEAA